jgi:hypothetical protein
MPEALVELTPGRPILALNALHSDLPAMILGASMRGARPAPANADHFYDGFTTTVIDCSVPIDADAFFSLLDQIPDALYRLKGWVQIQHSDRCERYALQAAGSRWRVEVELVEQGPDQVVVIGRSDNNQFASFCTELQALVGYRLSVAD